MLLLNKNIDLFVDDFMSKEFTEKYNNSNLHDFCMWLADNYSDLGVLDSYGTDTMPVGYSCNADRSRKEIPYIYIKFKNNFKVRVFKDSQDFFVSQVKSKMLKNELSIRNK